MGKAEFHLCHKLKSELLQEKKLQRHHINEYQEKHKACYQKAKNVIYKIGSALDGDYLESKEEELRMLDMAMVDCLQETNKLERCLLCRKKAKLKRSHYFPNSILKDFCSGLAGSGDQRVLLPSVNYQGGTKAPKEIIYYMLCQECEQLLSKRGESQFRPDFFLRIYDSSNPQLRKEAVYTIAS